MYISNGLDIFIFRAVQGRAGQGRKDAGVMRGSTFLDADYFVECFSDLNTLIFNNNGIQEYSITLGWWAY